MDYLPPCITSPGIAAVVHRRLNELYFAHLLEALHSAASGIGASFTTTPEKEDSISNEILEYLAFCVAVYWCAKVENKPGCSVSARQPARRAAPADTPPAPRPSSA